MPAAIEMTDYGPPSVLRAVERPARAPGPGEVVVRAVVAGVNRADLLIRSGEWPQGGGWPYVPGLETCGVVESVGESVSDLRAGDRVITMMQGLGGVHGTRPGGYQSHPCVPASTLARVPDAWADLDLAGTLGLPAVTAYFGLAMLDVRPGQRLLVHAGSSAVGLMAIQLGKRRGATVAASTTREAKRDVLLAAGADEVVLARGAGWAEGLAPLHAVLDLVGQATFAATVDRLADGGRYVLVGGVSGAAFAFDGWNLMRPVTLTGWSSESLDRAALQAAVDALAASGIRPVEVHRYPLAEAAGAHADLAAGERAGRFVLVP